MTVLIACEESGVVRDAFLTQHIDAISCDLLPTSSPGPHLECDVLDVISEPWDMVIAHPPCTRLCNSGVRWLHERDLWSDMHAAVEFFLRMLAANAPYVAVENPTMHGHARSMIGPPDFAVQPYEFGDAESKRTCFWTKHLPPLLPTTPGFDPRRASHSTHLAAPSADRARLRSMTFPGIAAAMATQWGSLIKETQ